jgi:16S rRNA (uracil1498-N3)-methyltransferase
MNLFYAPSLNNNSHTLDEEESRHCIRTLRLKKGDILHVTDGKGNVFETTILDPNPKRCTVEVTSVRKDYQKREFHLHIAIAPTKNTARFEWFLEKATEIGIDEITPLICLRSERTEIRVTRFEKVLIAAMKQSLKAYLPALHEPVKWHNFIDRPFNGQKFIASCDPEVTVALSNNYHKGTNALILIGPEGDFSKDEIANAKKSGFIPISLGKSRLRTETAGIVACHTINLMNE